MMSVWIHFFSLLWVSLLASFVYRYQHSVNTFQNSELNMDRLDYHRSANESHAESFCYYREIVSESVWTVLGVSCD